MRIFLALIAALLFSRAHAYADARSEALDKESYEMYQQVFSPFCPGRSLNDCPSSKAHELKVEMRQKLEQGVAPDVILQDVFARFGDKYRAVPLFEGFGRMVWLAPVAFLGVGFLSALAVVFRRKQSSSKKNSSKQSQISAELEQQIQEELSNLD